MAFKTQDGAAPAGTPIAQADFTLINHGSIVVLNANTQEARAWRDQHLTHPETQTWGKDGVVIEPRYVQDILDGIAADGLEVR